MIQFSLNTPLNLTGGDVTFKKVINEIECQYYFRKVKRISQYNPIVGQLAYSLNIYGDNRISLAFEDINIENVRDHLNRNLTELFLGIIKKPATVWTNPISGIMTNFSYSNYDINSIYQDGPTSFLESILSDTNDFYLDIVEFDIYNYRETPLSLVNHRFNLINRKDNGYLEGYYHIPFYKIDLDIISKSVQRSSQFSTSFSVEENDINYWRNNVPYSESSTIKHLNGKNYINLYNAMFVKRQTPCNNITLGLQNPILGKCVDLTSDISNLNEDQSC